MPLSRKESSRSLRRTKSITSSIFHSARNYENRRLSPEVSRDHALAAASKAFGLAGARSGNVSSVPQAGERNSMLRRTQSVRFTGSTATQFLQPSITRRQATTWAEVNGPIALSPPIQQRASPSQCERGVNALSQTRKISNPISSFKRLRKTKSLLSPRKNASEYFAHPSSSPLANSSLRSTPGNSSITRFPTGLTPGRAPPTAEELLLRLPNPYQSTYNQADAIQMARDEYLRQLEAQGISERPSFSSIGTRRPPPRVFRRTVRSSSTNSYGNAVGSELSQPPMSESRVVSKTRKLSGSIKGKLRRMFGGSSQSSLPSQQVSATREHYDRAPEDVAHDPTKNPQIPVPPRALLRKHSSRSPSPSPSGLPAYVSQINGDTAGSIRSKKSNDSLKAGSRVTSWANSAISNEATSQCGPPASTSERNRLSVIQENLPHQPSSSANKAKGLEYAAFRKPLRPGRINEPVDAEIMVSALKKRIEERNRAQDGSQDIESQDLIQPANKIPWSKTSRIQRSRFGTTIRKIDSSEEEPDIPQITRLKKDRNFDVEANEADDVFQPERPRSSRHKRTNAQVSHKLSFQNIADLNEANLSAGKAKPQETRGRFFPGKDQYPVYRTSPLKNSVQMNAEGEFPLADAHRTPQRQNLHRSTDSVSVYSRKTTGTPLGRRNANEADGLGTAYIIDTKPMVSQYQNIVSHARKRVASDRSTGSWKGWMASEVSKIEGSEDTERRLRSPTWTYKGFGHVREEAEGDGEITCTKQRKTSGPKQILGFARKFSSKHSDKRKVSSQSSDFESAKSQLSQMEENMSKKPSESRWARGKAVVNGMRIGSNENKRPATAFAGSRNLPSSLSYQENAPSASLSRIEESPLTPFSKFMATDNSPMQESPLLMRPATSMSTQRSPEREMRLRRMQSSLPGSSRNSGEQKNRYPWLQDYHDREGLNELPSVNASYSPQLRDNYAEDDSPGRPRSRANRTVELFLNSRHRDLSHSPTPAFI